MFRLFLYFSKITAYCFFCLLFLACQSSVYEHPWLPSSTKSSETSLSIEKLRPHWEKISEDYGSSLIATATLLNTARAHRLQRALLPEQLLNQDETSTWKGLLLGKGGLGISLEKLHLLVLKSFYNGGFKRVKIDMLTCAHGANRWLQAFTHTLSLWQPAQQSMYLLAHLEPLHTVIIADYKPDYRHIALFDVQKNHRHIYWWSSLSLGKTLCSQQKPQHWFLPGLLLITLY